MKNAFFALLICCLFAVSCHRPYALYQRMPVETFRQPSARIAPQPAPTPVLTDSSDWVSLLADSAALPEPAPEAVASILPLKPSEPSGRIRQHARHVASLLHTSAATSSSEVEAQPRPKPKARTGEKKTLREILGLKPRPKLNWWQRIHWSLKASVPVILVAVIFALLKINLLAIIFGLLGAFLLIRGLKKEFKVRRPWF